MPDPDQEPEPLDYAKPRERTKFEELAIVLAVWIAAVAICLAIVGGVILLLFWFGK
jgi:hypothetical protein